MKGLGLVSFLRKVRANFPKEIALGTMFNFHIILQFGEKPTNTILIFKVSGMNPSYKVASLLKIEKTIQYFLYKSIVVVDKNL